MRKLSSLQKEIMKYHDMCSDISKTIQDSSYLISLERNDLSRKYIDSAEKDLRSIDDKLFDAKIQFYKVKRKLFDEIKE